MSGLTHYEQYPIEENDGDISPEINSIDDIKLTIIDLPPDLREPQFDMVLIYARDDEKLCLVFKDILEKFVKLDDGRNAKVCVLDREDNLPHIRSKFKHLEDAVKRSTYMFLFMSKNFVTDSWAELQGDECLQESIDNPDKKWCVIPIHCLPKQKGDYDLPFGLRALKGVRCDRILTKTNKTFSESLDIEELKEGNLDPYFIRQMSGLFNIRLRDKLERERKQKRQTEEWIREEKLRRFKEAKDREREEKIKEEMHKKKLELIMQTSKEDLQKRREEIDNMTVSDVLKPQPPEPDFPVRHNYGPPPSQPMAVNIYVDSRHRVDIGDENESVSTPIIHRYNNDSTDSSLSPSDNTFYTSPPRSHNMNITGSLIEERPLQNVNKVPTENEDIQRREPQEDSVADTSVDAVRQMDGGKTEKIDAGETPAKTVPSPYTSLNADTKPYKLDQQETMNNDLSVGGKQSSILKSQSYGSKLSSGVSDMSKITCDGACDSDARASTVNSSQSKNFSGTTSSGKLSQGSLSSTNRLVKMTQPINNQVTQPTNSQEQPNMIGQYPHISAEEYRQMQSQAANQHGQPGIVPSYSAPGNLQLEQMQAQMAQMYPNMVPGAMPVGHMQGMYAPNMQMHPGMINPGMNPGYIQGLMPNMDQYQIQHMMLQQMKQLQEMQMLMLKANPNFPLATPDSTPSPVLEDSQKTPQIANLFPQISSSNSRASISNQTSNGGKASSSKSRDYSSEDSSDASISLAASMYLEIDGGRIEQPEQNNSSLDLPEHPYQPQPRTKAGAELLANADPSLNNDESLLPETPHVSVLVSGLTPGHSSVTPTSYPYSSGYGTEDDMMFQSIRVDDYKDIKLNLNDIPKSPEIQPSLPSKCDSVEVSLTNSSVGGSTFLQSGDMSDRSDSFSDSLGSDGGSTRRNSSQMSSVREQTLKSNQGLLNINANNNHGISSLNALNCKRSQVFRSLPDSDLETQV